MFLAHDLDYFVAVRKPPYTSWKNPAERVMSKLNLALQAAGMMKEKLVTATLEKVLESCNLMKDICTAAKNHPGLQDEFKDCVQPPKILLSSLFQRLKLKDEPFTLFQSSESSEIELFLGVLKQIDPNLQFTLLYKGCSTSKVERFFRSLLQFKALHVFNQEMWCRWLYYLQTSPFAQGYI